MRYGFLFLIPVVMGLLGPVVVPSDSSVPDVPNESWVYGESRVVDEFIGLAESGFSIDQIRLWEIRVSVAGSDGVSHVAEIVRRVVTVFPDGRIEDCVFLDDGSVMRFYMG